MRPHDSEPPYDAGAEAERPAGTEELPREIEPARDLWPGIAGRLRVEERESAPAGLGAPAAPSAPSAPAAPAAPAPPKGRVLPGRFDGWRRPLLAVAATLIVFFAGYATRDLTGVDGLRSDAAGPTIDETVRAARNALGPAVAPGAPGAAQDGGTDAVVAALEQRKDELDPATVEVILRNLDVLDQASREIREALEKDPGNIRLERMLSDGEERRGAVLRRAASLLNVI